MTAPIPGPPPSSGQPVTYANGQSGGARIEAALADLAEVKDTPPAEQVAPLARAHQVLRETLDSIGDV